MKSIPLTKDQSVIVDDNLYDLLIRWKWYCGPGGYASRAVTKLGKHRAVFMHRILIVLHYGDIPQGCEVDHINGDRRDCRIENLRIVTRKENTKNRSKCATRETSSRYFGVSFHKRKVTKPWQAYLGSRPRTCLGYFDTEIEAAMARDKRALELWGEFARLNFPGAASIPAVA